MKPTYVDYLIDPPRPAAVCANLPALSVQADIDVPGNGIEIHRSQPALAILIAEGTLGLWTRLALTSLLLLL